MVHRAAFLCFVLAASAGIGALVSQTGPPVAAMLILAVGAIVVAPLLLRALRRRFDPFEPIAVFAIAYGALFVIRPAVLLATDRLYVDAWFRVIYITDTFNWMLVLAALGAAAFVITYELPIGASIARMLPKPSKDFDTGRVAFFSVVTGVLGVLLYSLFLAQAGVTIFTTARDPLGLTLYRNSSAYLTTGAYLLVPASLVLIAVGGLRRRRNILLLGLLALALLLLFVLPRGNRLPLLPLASGLLVYFHARNGTRPRFVALLIISALALLMASFVMNARSPQFREREEASLQDLLVQVVTNPYHLVEPLVGPDNSYALTFSAALTIIPEEIPFQYGRDTLGDLVTRPIPRKLWPSKPPTPVQQTVEELWPRAYYLGIANPEFSTLLAFYRDFGVAGILAGMGLYGVIARAWYEYFLLHRESIMAQLLFGAGLAFVVIGMRDNPVDNLWRASLEVFPIWIIFQLAARQTRTSVTFQHPHPKIAKTIV